MRRTTLTAALATLVAAGGLIAASPAMNAQDSIKARQSHYKEIGKSFKTIRDELMKPAPDKAVIAASADTMANYAPQIQGWFPKGSGSEAGIKTGAKAEIWSDPKGFQDQINQFVERTKKFQSIAHNGDLTEVKTFIPMLGGACKSCHDRFRVKES